MCIRYFLKSASVLKADPVPSTDNHRWLKTDRIVGKRWIDSNSRRQVEQTISTDRRDVVYLWSISKTISPRHDEGTDYFSITAHRSRFHFRLPSARIAKRNRKFSFSPSRWNFALADRFNLLSAAIFHPTMIFRDDFDRFAVVTGATSVARWKSQHVNHGASRL